MSNNPFYYKVLDKIFYSDLRALEYISSKLKNDKPLINKPNTGLEADFPHYLANKGALEFNLNLGVMHQDWTNEPQHDIEYYREQTCRALESKYDKIVLGYSGGTDSETILETFKKIGTRNIHLLNGMNAESHVFSKTRTELNADLAKRVQKKHRKDIDNLGWQVDIGKVWNTTNEKQYEDMITDYKIGHWSGDYKNVNGWHQDSGKVRLTKTKTSNTAFVLGQEKPEILIENDWWVYKLLHQVWDLPLAAMDPNSEVVYFWVNDFEPNLIKKLSHLKAKEMDKIFCELKIKPTPENCYQLCSTLHASKYYDRVTKAMGFKAISPLLQSSSTKIGGEWFKLDAKTQLESQKKHSQQTLNKNKIANDYFDQEIVKKVDSRFINKNKRTFIPIWGRSIKIRPVSEALGKIISDKDTR